MKAMALPDCPPLKWAEVERELHAAAAKIVVKEINGEAQDVLDYFEYRETGRSVIAVGGDKLSRGLTLEGLSISYYGRVTKMYDSLMQMGRWFGYRDGYLDLCRLYTTRELQQWYRYVTLADLELRREFEAMWQAGRTPHDYGLRVRTHPDGLLVTAMNKSRLGEKVRISYTGELVQTAYLDKKKSVIQDNLALTDSFLRRLGKAENVNDIKGGRDARLWRGVAGVRIEEFLRTFIVHPRAFQADGGRLAQYIQKQREAGNDGLSEWTVALISSTRARVQSSIGGQKMVGLSARNPQMDDNDKETDPTVYALRQRNIITPADQYLDFEGQLVTPELIRKVLSKGVFAGEAMKEERDIINAHLGEPVVKMALALTKHRAERKEAGSSAGIREPSGRIVRELRPDTQGLLMLYALDPSPSKGIAGLDAQITEQTVPIMGFAVSFPVSERDVPIEYLVNEIYRIAERTAESFDPEAVEALSDD